MEVYVGHLKDELHKYVEGIRYTGLEDVIMTYLAKLLVLKYCGLTDEIIIGKMEDLDVPTHIIDTYKTLSAVPLAVSKDTPE